MAGILYLCATPIGNLGDISQRVIETLSQVDLIAAEDTRNSIRLLNHFQIKTPMTSYHEYNKFDKAEKLIEQLVEGKSIALISDAGTPAISDPGEVLVDLCHKQGIIVTSLPGPCALITALTVSGLSTKRFCFEGFLPSDKKQRKKILTSLENETRTIIIYEAPHHIQKTIEELNRFLGNRRITVCRELTKKFETILQSTFEDFLQELNNTPPRGEYVVVIEGKDPQIMKADEIQNWMTIPLAQHMQLYVDKGLMQKEAMKEVAKDRGVTKREIYQQLLNE